jgi:hypothetical protein
MFRLFLLTSVGVLIVFFSYKSIIYLTNTKVEAEVIRLEKRNLKSTNVRSNRYSGTGKSYSYEPVQAPVFSYRHKNNHYEVSNPYWGKANNLKEKDKITLLINEKSDEIHLVTFTHFWFTSQDIINVFSLIFILTVIFSIFFNKDKVKKPHPLFKNKMI